MTVPDIEKDPTLYGVSGQVQHKKEFIEKFVPKSTRLCLLGHSFGAKTIVELMKDKEFAERVNEAHLLFPTLEHIAETPSGHRFRNVLSPLLSLLLVFTYILAALPRLIRIAVVKIALAVMMMRNYKKGFLDGVLTVIKTNTVRRVFHLAKDEMKQIKELDHEVFDNYADKLSLYYGLEDGWSPLSHYENLKKTHPNVTSTVLDKKFNHLFVLHTSEDMAEFLADKIKCIQVSKDN